MARQGTKQHKYSSEEISWLKENYKKHERPILLKMFNSTFHSDISDGALKSILKSHKIFSGRTGRFVKGQVSFNKGLRWDDFMTPAGRIRSLETTFKKGHTPCNTLPIGTLMMKGDGYVWVKVRETGLPNRPWRLWEQKHRLVWEGANGPIPKGYNIIFLDGNRWNFDLSNLMMLSKRQHATMCKLGMYTKDPDLTKTGILVVEVIRKACEKRETNEKQAN
ncbi:MAG: HNH endonuclease signature motif containing protein [Candidatus Izemoplasmatales bacterium]|nr:HNH endonuclease signature motif containing protein [Candidatus Izemoplasmatales bacterium]